MGRHKSTSFQHFSKHQTCTFAPLCPSVTRVIEGFLDSFSSQSYLLPRKKSVSLRYPQSPSANPACTSPNHSKGDRSFLWDFYISVSYFLNFQVQNSPETYESFLNFMQHYLWWQRIATKA